MFPGQTNEVFPGQTNEVSSRSDAGGAGLQPGPPGEECPPAGPCGLRRGAGGGAVADGCPGRRSPGQKSHDPQQVGLVLNVCFGIFDASSVGLLILFLISSHSLPSVRSKANLSETPSLSEAKSKSRA